MRQIMEMMPGFNKLVSSPEVEEALESDQLKYIEAIILSMTKEERRNTDIINGSRRKRVARGSGTTVQEVNQLLEQFGEMRNMIRQISSGKGPWAKMARQFAGEAGIPDMPGLSTPARSGGKKKVGKPARKEKRKHKSKRVKSRLVI